MAVIVKADIIADVDDNLQTALGFTDLDKAIIKTLSDMSNRGLLVGIDATQVLVDGDTTLAYPTGFRKGGVINITLIDAAGLEKGPLEKMHGGHNEYRKLRHNDSSAGTTVWFSEFNKEFYLWRPANQAYTTLIEYSKNHAKDADNIEFETEFENLMFAGATYWYAAKLGRPTALSLWGPIYNGELRLAMLNRNFQPSTIRG
jgi:hypothetical protein